jgi:hypothetical protein
MIKAAGDNDQAWSGQRPELTPSTMPTTGTTPIGGVAEPTMPAAPTGEGTPFAAGRTGVTGP